ncbi:hypothetical protein Pint_07455 [Pistacia integerrima]|uniref:Uncharacterized protein n=2 Tax=Pistacia TaxID=55512 RepID=A0ACC1ALJ3_9ROSI|nr:hypothetical protein Pint_07455 [Pistacia integerrima]KAJ0087541.1 hypothetical protein Patl1_07561 [Pistacia atlantica]
MAKVKVATLFMILLLVVFSTLTYATPPELTFPDNGPTKTQLDTNAKYIDCKGASEEMSLMMRITDHTDYIYTEDENLHIDYIYTQDENP